MLPTAVKTSAYTASPGDFIPVDASGGSVTVTLPTAPADKAQIAVKLISLGATTNTVTINAGGSDVFNKAGGSTSLSLSLLNQGVVLQYAHATAIWYVQSDDLPLSQTDARYTKIDTNVYNFKDHGGKVDGTTDDSTALTSLISTVNAAGGGTIFIPAGTCLL